MRKTHGIQDRGRHRRRRLGHGAGPGLRAGPAWTSCCRRASPRWSRASATRRDNEAFLPGRDPGRPRSRATADLADLAGCDLILAVPPAQHMRSTLTAFAAHHRAGLPVVLCSKGIEQGSLKLMTEVLAETLPAAPAAVLSGPSFAGEVARGLPTAVTLACADEALGEELMRTLSPPGFRPYLADRHDRRRGRRGGEERAGHRLRHRRGPRPGPQRPRRPDHPRLRRDDPPGRGAGRPGRDGRRPLRPGRPGADLLQPAVAQHERRPGARPGPDARTGAGRQALGGRGRESAPAVRELAAKMGVDMPISQAVAALLGGETTVEAVIDNLLSRPLKAERH